MITARNKKLVGRASPVRDCREALMLAGIESSKIQRFFERPRLFETRDSISVMSMEDTLYARAFSHATFFLLCFQDDGRLERLEKFRSRERLEAIDRSNGNLPAAKAAEQQRNSLGWAAA
jgi:hypothetical protein